MFKMALTLNSINKLRQIINNSDLYNRRKRISAIRKLGNLRYTDADGLLMSNKLVKPADAVEEQLLSLLVDKDSEIRRAAAKVLGKRGKTEFTELIHGDNGDYARLGNARDSRVLSVLAKASTNSSLVLDVRRIIDGTLAGMAGKLDTNRLIAMLNDDTLAGVHSIIIKELASRNDIKDTTPFESIFHKCSTKDQGEILKILAEPRGNNPEAVDPVLEKNFWSYNGFNQNKQNQIIDILAAQRKGDSKKLEFELYRRKYSIKYSDPFELLKELAINEAVPSNMQTAAMEAMPGLNDSRAVEFLEDCLADSHENIAKAAASALAEMGKPQWQEKLTMCLSRWSRYKGIASSGEPRAFEILSNAYSMSDYDERKMIIKEVAAIKDNPKVLDFLVTQLKRYRYRCEADTNDDYRLIGYDYYYDAEFICEALASLKDSRALEPLQEALKYNLIESPKDDADQWKVRAAAEKALSSLGDKRAVDALKKAKKDRDSLVSSAANISLEALKANKR